MLPIFFGLFSENMRSSDIGKSVKWCVPASSITGTIPAAKPSPNPCCLELYGHEIVNTLRPRRNRRHFADDIFKCIFLDKNVLISIKISLKFIPKGPIDNIPTSVQIMAWRRPGDKPLSEPMMKISLTHVCVARPQ